MKRFDQTNKFTVVTDDIGIDITELQKLREAKSNVTNVGNNELISKLDEKIKEEEQKYVVRVLATNVADENKKERERKCNEAFEAVDAVASTIKKVIKWAYSRRH